MRLKPLRKLMFDPSRFARFMPLLFVAAAIFLSLFLLPAVADAQSGGAKGKVRNTSGRSIPNATVAARQDGKEVKTARTDRNGNFTMTGLRPGTYNFSFDADGYSTGVLHDVVIGNRVRDLGSRLVLNIDQGTLVLIRGSVFYKEGVSFPGVRVELQVVNKDGSTRTLTSAYSNSSGEFAFRRPPGDAVYRVTASHRGVSYSKDIEVDGPAIYRTSLILDVSRSQ
jgi:hypothetical protein